MPPENELVRPPVAVAVAVGNLDNNKAGVTWPTPTPSSEKAGQPPPTTTTTDNKGQGTTKSGPVPGKKARFHPLNDAGTPIKKEKTTKPTVKNELKGDLFGNEELDKGDNTNAIELQQKEE